MLEILQAAIKATISLGLLQSKAKYIMRSLADTPRRRRRRSLDDILPLRS